MECCGGVVVVVSRKFFIFYSAVSDELELLCQVYLDELKVTHRDKYV